MDNPDAAYEQAAQQVIELGNGLVNARPEEQEQGDALWDVADGLLAGAVQFWLYSRQPCGDPMCPDCATISTAELRLQELLQFTRELAETSDYFHSTTDSNVGHS